MDQNGKCIPCPRNSNTSVGKIMCQCKTGFYRFRGENYAQPCHGRPFLSFFKLEYLTIRLRVRDFYRIEIKSEFGDLKHRMGTKFVWGLKTSNKSKDRVKIIFSV